MEQLGPLKANQLIDHVHRRTPTESGNTVGHESEEGLLHLELSVEHHEFGARRDEIVAFVEHEELDEYLILIVWK